jgi:hypothetical protein
MLPLVIAAGLAAIPMVSGPANPPGPTTKPKPPPVHCRYVYVCPPGQTQFVFASADFCNSWPDLDPRDHFKCSTMRRW